MEARLAVGAPLQKTQPTTTLAHVVLYLDKQFRFLPGCSVGSLSPPGLKRAGPWAR